MVTLYFECGLLVILLGLSGFFSGSETALFSLSKYQLDNLVRKHPTNGTIVRSLLERPRRLIVTILLGNEFVNVAISSISTLIVIRLLGVQTPWINLFIVLPILLIFGEISPKTLAIKRNEGFARIIARPLDFFAHFISPVRWLIRKISDGIVNLFITSSSRRGSILTEDVFKTIVEEGEKEGVIDSLEREYINNIFDFGDTRVDDIMTARANLFCLPVDLSLRDIIKQIKEEHYSKVPIYEDNRDNIIGILFATDLIGLSRDEIDNSATTLKQILHKPLFVPVTKRADELFQLFQKKKISVAIVLDEYGGVQGLVSMEDLLEEIFGEISDEFEAEETQHEKISEHIFKIEGTMPLTEFNQLLGTEIISEEVETIGGFVFSLFGEFPKPKASITYQNIQFIIDKIDGYRIVSLLVKLK
jgi:putative hemolysin